MAEDIQMAMQAGMNDYLAKPIAARRTTGDARKVGRTVLEDSRGYFAG